MTAQAESARPDVSEMVAVHRVFRDTLLAAPSLIEAVGRSDAGRRALVSNFYENVLSFLHAHHQTEEDLVFPLLRERCPDQVSTVDRAATQHTRVLESVRVAEDSVAAWAGADAGAQQRCAQQLAELGRILDQHLDDEEGELLPLCAEHLSIEEWGAQPGHGLSLYDGDKVWLVLGLIRERMTAGQRDEMITNMPPPAVEMWQGFGQQAFRDLIAVVGPPLSDEGASG